jgi:copper homeostasis protein
MVMIRPRGGDFCYTSDEIAAAFKEIDAASEFHADGVVLGVIRDHSIDAVLMERLVKRAKDHGLAVAFHRAFDAVADRLEALKTLIDLGVERVLTNGTS